jgi:hypothetical protein
MKINFAYPNYNFIKECWSFRAFLDICNEIDKLKKVDSTFWYVWCDYNFPVAQFKPNKNDIVFFHGDEHYRLPSWHKECLLVLKQTVTNDFPENIVHYPFLYNTDFLKFPRKPIKEREIDVFFSGTLWPETNRQNILNHLSHKLPGVNFLFKEKLDAKEYSYILSNSKICLSLDGKWTPECIRFSEGILSGCVVLSSNLSYSKLFNEVPYVKVDWNNLDEVCLTINQLLADNNKMEEISLKAESFWYNHWTPKHWANLIISKIDNKDIK